MNLNLLYITPLFFLPNLVALGDVCPNHSDIKASYNFTGISYDERHATMRFLVDNHYKSLNLTFKLPARPPFARTSMPYYNQDYSYGRVNWGFTEQYKHDFSQEIIKYTSFRQAHVHGKLIDCVYVSLLENDIIFGHIWIDSR